MFDNLLQLVRDNAGSAIINNSAIPNEHNDAAIATAAIGIMNHLKGLVNNDGVEALSSLFQNNTTHQHAVVADMTTTIAGNLMHKFGLNTHQASGVVNNLIPQVMNQFVHKTNDPNDQSFDIQSIIGSLSGGDGLGDVMKTVKGLF